MENTYLEVSSRLIGLDLVMRKLGETIAEQMYWFGIIPPDNHQTAKDAAIDR